MQRAQIIGVFAFLFAAGWLLVPRELDETITGSIVESVALPDAAISCDQPLYMDELELVTGLSCS